MQDKNPSDYKKSLVTRESKQPRAHTSKSKIFGKLSGSFLLLVLCFIAAYTGGIAANQDSKASPVSENDGNLVVTRSEQGLSSLIEKVSPSVVSIITSITDANGGTQAAGTGMIVSADGYVLTNKHVIRGAKDIVVIASNGTAYRDVKVVGTDPLNDVAFLQIKNVKNLHTIAIGDSKTVRVGQNVVAIGNALGEYQNSVTTGIISGLGRPVFASEDGTEDNAESLSDLLQTDAAINPGNSGGPLLNMQGQVVGINTAIAYDAQGIGFAIPIGATKGMLRHLVATGKLERAIMGVQYVSITPEVKAEYNLPVDHGDYITASSGKAIRPGGPSARAGVKENDIILKVNGESIGPGKSSSTLLGEYVPGDSVKLTILRGKITKTILVTLAAY